VKPERAIYDLTFRNTKRIGFSMSTESKETRSTDC